MGTLDRKIREGYYPSELQQDALGSSLVHMVRTLVHSLLIFCSLVSCPSGSWIKSGMRLECAASISGDAVQNLISRSGPNEWFGIFVVRVDKLSNRRLQFSDAAECAAPDSFVGEFGEPSLNQIQPGAIGRRKVDMESRALGQPVADDRRLVSAVVVEDEVNVQIGWDLSLDHIQKPAEFHGAMASVELANHAAGLQIQSGKQRSRAVAFIVVGAALQLPRLHGQQRLSPVQCLNLALFVDAEHQRVIGWVDIQASDVAHFFDQQRVWRQLESIRTVRLQSEGAPNAADGHSAESGGFRQSSRAPVRLPARRAF